MASSSSSLSVSPAASALHERAQEVVLRVRRLRLDSFLM